MKNAVVCFLLFGASNTLVHSLDSFRAAVYEHNVTFPADRTKILPREEALQVMKNNLAVYAQQAKLASDMGARIIVFPEYGLYGLGWTRQTIAPYLEYVPDPITQKWNPCDEPALYNSTEVQHTLSCIAKHSSIYLVANMGARIPCMKSSSKCPVDHQYQYSANVVYGPNGDFLARYFKYNLYIKETHFDKPQKVDLTTFETPFGRFGTFSSLDIFYYDPAISLIEKMNITNIAFPTAWSDDLPLLSAIELHSAFAVTMASTFLAANLHLPATSYHGSGLYWPWDTSVCASYYYNDSLSSSGYLVVDTLKGCAPSPDRITRMSRGSTSKVKYDRPNNRDTFEATINGDRYTAISLTTSYGASNVCQHDLCCNLEYEGEFAPGELFALGAFDGFHTKGEKYYLQACVFIKCANISKESCGVSTKESLSSISKMSFFGNFSSKYVLPEILTNQNGVPGLEPQMWSYGGALIIDVGLNGGPISISLLSIDYLRNIEGLEHRTLNIRTPYDAYGLTVPTS
ncbi:hypothetical protein ACJMK2_020046 [Sinanodonta woodiana]|uniref:CN hydrolase domain-containing protein n=1 Tax=Sinanodonta woodiana TaxID=1069815 RepID=A0ABD3TY61_SINWO